MIEAEYIISLINLDNAHILGNKSNQDFNYQRYIPVSYFEIADLK